MADLVVPHTHTDLLHADGFAFVATIARAHRPHVSPTWYLWDDDRQQLLISLTDTRQKYRNLRHTPEVAVCLMQPRNPYRYLELRGTVTSMDVDKDHQLIDTLARKYVGADRFHHDPADGTRLTVRITPRYARAFG